MDRHGRSGLRGRRARRTRQQIRQQTSSVGMVYPVFEGTHPDSRQSTAVVDVQSLPLFGEAGNNNQAPSDGDTAARMDTPVPHTDHAAVCRAPGLGLDCIDRGDSSPEKGSGSEDLGENSNLLVDIAKRATSIFTEEPLSEELHGSMLDATVSENYRTELLVRWQSIAALLLTCGTVRVTVNHYETVRELFGWSSRYGNLPSIRTVQRTIMPAIRDFAYARSTVCSLRTKSKHCDASTARSAEGDSGEGQVRVVLPSDWAVLDCRTGPLFQSMFGEGRCIQRSRNFKTLFSDIEETPIIQRRLRFLNTNSQVYVDAPCTGTDPHQERLPVQASAGDVVHIHLLHPEDFRTIIGHDGAMATPTRESGHLLATIRAVWLIEGCRPVQDPMQPQEDASFSVCSLLKNGDTVAEIVPYKTNRCQEGTQNLYLLVFRFCRTSPGEATRQLVIIKRDRIEEGRLPANRCVTANVVRVQMHHEPILDAVTSFSPSTGFLHDGRKYVVYRVLLYSDDFQANVSRSGSYGGCYMLPLGIKPEERAGYAAVRCIGLTAPNVSTNEVLLRIIPDIVNCTKTGVEGKDAMGESVTVFLDVVGYIGDYPAVTHALDVLGHNSRAPCHLCSFVRQDRTGATGLNYYGYSTSVHSRASAFCREAGRIRSVRSDVFPSSLFQSLGLKYTIDEGLCPLHVLSDALSKVRSQVPLTDRGVPVVPAVFDPYRSSMVAPDHLLFGLAQDVINACITLCSPGTRATAESLMRGALFEHDLGTQKQLFSRTSLTLHSMTMSEVFAILLVAPSSFYTALALHDAVEASEISEMRTDQQQKSTESIGIASSSRKDPRTKRARRGSISTARPNRAGARAIDLIQLLEKFQKLVAETHYLPRIDVDGLEPVQEFNDRHGASRLDRLFHLASQYVSDLHRVCTLSIEGVGKILNKPNVHRLLELYAHTLPAFGHIRHFQELLFETAHQPLKRGIKRSNNRDPHLAAVTAVLANDWEKRLALEAGSAGDPEEWSDATCRRILQLLTGVESNDSAHCSRVRSAFCPPILSQLEKVRRRLLSTPSARVEWKIEHVAHGRPPSFEGTWRARSTLNRSSLDQALDCFTTRTKDAGIDQMSLRIGLWASSWNIPHTDDFVSHHPASSERRKESVQTGSLVQSLVRPGPLCSNPTCPVRSLECPVKDEHMGDSSFKVSYWLVLDVFEVESQCNLSSAGAETGAQAVVLPCIEDEGEKRRFRANCEGPAFILPLGTSTRAALCLHACNPGACASNVATGNVRPSCEVSRGCSFYGLGRRDGYPPRIA